MKSTCATAAVVMSLSVAFAAARAEVGCIVYQHRDFKGSFFEMERKSYLQMGGERIGRSVSDGVSPHGYYARDWNDQVSSVRVFQGCTATLWEHVGPTGGAGAQFVARQSYAYVGDRFNDKTSWVDCDCSVSKRPPQGSTAVMHWPFKSDYKFKAEVKLFSRTRNAVWPSGGRTYMFDDYKQYNINISCNVGEQVCYGAWPSGTNASTYWGVGRDGTKGCSDCCRTCTGGKVEGTVLGN